MAQQKLLELVAMDNTSDVMLYYISNPDFDVNFRGPVRLGNIEFGDYTPFEIAAFNGNKVLMQFFALKGADLKAQGEQAIILAMKNFKKLDYLIELGVKIGQTDSNPLSYACQFNTDYIDELLSFGAVVPGSCLKIHPPLDQITFDTFSKLFIRSKKENILRTDEKEQLYSFCSYLSSDDNYDTKIMDQYFSFFDSHGISPDEKCISLAVTNNSSYFTNYLPGNILSQINEQDDLGQTPIFKARNTESVSALIANGALVDHQRKDRKTALILLAIEISHKSKPAYHLLADERIHMFQQFLKAKAKTKIFDRTRRSVIEYLTLEFEGQDQLNLSEDDQFRLCVAKDLKRIIHWYRLTGRVLHSKYKSAESCLNP